MSFTDMDLLISMQLLLLFILHSSGTTGNPKDIFRFHEAVAQKVLPFHTKQMYNALKKQFNTVKGENV